MKARKSLPLVVAAVLLALAAVTAGAAPLAPPPPSPPYIGPGPYCVANTGVTPLNCTANDTRVSQLTPSITDVCTGTSDSADVLFHADLVIGATTRWDLGMYVASDGGSAESGSMCYKDVLQPVADLAAPGDPTNPDGTGPFKNEDDDSCGEANQTVGAHYQLQPMTIACADNNGDGVVDPISTCLSWGNEANQYVCGGVSATMPGPGTGSKCNCQTVAPIPPVLIYSGYDWGDLPEGPRPWGGTYSYQTLTANGGARHAIQDLDKNNIPNTQGSVAAVWLGPTVDFSPNAETDGQPNAAATGDDINLQNGKLVDDEDGVTPVGLPWTAGPGGGQVSVNVNSSEATCTGCKLGFWIDWNDDGDFAESNEYYLKDVVKGTNALTFDIPLAADLMTIKYARFRLYAGEYVGLYQSYGEVGNGEVEDYYFLAVPTAVKMRSFTAIGKKKAINLKWETANESNNLGFNLYRATAADGERTKINKDLIPSLVPPGSSFGAVYVYTDAIAAKQRRTTFYYWVEHVGISGGTSLYDPVSVKAR